MKKIIENLYLGDMNSAPKDTELRISCAEEIYLKMAPDKEKNSFYDEADKCIYYKFEDYPIFEEMEINLVKDAINTIEQNIDNKKIYVHCLWGVNRSASIVFMFLVRNGHIKSSDYYEAQTKFNQIYPKHSPNPGWKDFLIKMYPYKF